MEPYERHVLAARDDAVEAILKIAEAYFGVPDRRPGSASAFFTRGVAFDAIEGIERQLRMTRDRVLLDFDAQEQPPDSH